MAVVLSGGGAKAAAQIGAVRALLEQGGVPRHYVGTSMGSVVAACFASGLEYADVLERVTAVERRDVARLSPGMLLGPFAGSLLRAAPLRETIRSLVPANAFEELETPLTVLAVDEERGDLVLFGEGGRTDVSLVDALYASCALPSYYPAQIIDGRSYVDGGLRSVLPLDVAGQFDIDLIYAVRTGPSFDAEPGKTPARLPPLIRIFGNAIRIMMAAQTDAEVARWRDGPVPVVLVQPTVEEQSTFAVSEVGRFVANGYEAGNRALERWLATA